MRGARAVCEVVVPATSYGPRAAWLPQSAASHARPARALREPGLSNVSLRVAAGGAVGGAPRAADIFFESSLFLSILSRI